MHNTADARPMDIAEEALSRRGYTEKQIQAIIEERNKYMFDKPHEWIDPFGDSRWWEDYSWLECELTEEIKKVEEHLRSLIGGRHLRMDEPVCWFFHRSADLFDSVWYMRELERAHEMDSEQTGELLKYAKLSEMVRLEQLNGKIKAKKFNIHKLEEVLDNQREVVKAMQQEYRGLLAHLSARKVEHSISDLLGFDLDSGKWNNNSNTDKQ